MCVTGLVVEYSTTGIVVLFLRHLELCQDRNQLIFVDLMIPIGGKRIVRRVEANQSWCGQRVDDQYLKKKCFFLYLYKYCGSQVLYQAVS